MDHYVCVADTITLRWCYLVSFNDLASLLKALINHVAHITKPISYFEATQHDGCKKVTQKELDAPTVN